MSELNGVLPTQCFKKIKKMYVNACYAQESFKRTSLKFGAYLPLDLDKFFENWTHNILHTFSPKVINEKKDFDLAVSRGYFYKKKSELCTRYGFTEAGKNYLKIMLVL